MNPPLPLATSTLPSGLNSNSLVPVSDFQASDRFRLAQLQHHDLVAESSRGDEAAVGGKSHRVDFFAPERELLLDVSAADVPDDYLAFLVSRAAAGCQKPAVRAEIHGIELGKIGRRKP